MTSPFNGGDPLALGLPHGLYSIQSSENWQTPDDLKNFSAFVEAMKDIYEVEKDWKEALLWVFNDSDIHIASSDKFSADGDLAVAGSLSGKPAKEK